MNDVAGLVCRLKLRFRNDVVGEQRIEIGGETGVDLGGTDVVIDRLRRSRQRNRTGRKVERLPKLCAVRLPGKAVALRKRHGCGLSESVGAGEQAVQRVETPVLLIN